MKTKRPFSQVMPIAEKLVSALSPFCERIEIAGSLRRKADTIGDIEIIAIPIMHTNLFGEIDNALPTLLDHRLDALTGDAIQHTEPKRWGDKLKSFVMTTTRGEDYQVDLFLQPDPQTWGVNMMIRTGCAEFSKRMVTQQSKGGWMPDDMFVRAARLWRNGEALSTPEETLVFGAMGMDWIEPQDRRYA